VCVHKIKELTQGSTIGIAFLLLLLLYWGTGV
jgi:hypothetical protein